MTRLVRAMTFLLACSSVSCGGEAAHDRDDLEPGAPGDADSSERPTDAGSTNWTLLHELPSAGVRRAEEGSRLAVESVVAATRAGGSSTWITAGTLKSVGGVLQYLPQPESELVVELADGSRYEIEVRQMRGALEKPGEFLDRDHTLDVRLRAEGKGDVEIRSSNLGGRRTSSIGGTLIEERASYQVDLTYDGTLYFENDSTGSEYRHEYRLTGSVTSEQTRVDFDEDIKFEHVLYDGEGLSNDVDASYDRRHSRGQVKIGNDVHAWEFTFRKAFKRGLLAGGPDAWECSGTLLKNGAPYGVYQKETQVFSDEGRAFSGVITFNLMIGDRKIELQRWSGP